MRHSATQFPGQAYETVSREAISYTYIFYLKMRHNFCLSTVMMIESLISIPLIQSSDSMQSVENRNWEQAKKCKNWAQKKCKSGQCALCTTCAGTSPRCRPPQGPEPPGLSAGSTSSAGTSWNMKTRETARHPNLGSDKSCTLRKWDLVQWSSLIDLLSAGYWYFFRDLSILGNSGKFLLI